MGSNTYFFIKNETKKRLKANKKINNESITNQIKKCLNHHIKLPIETLSNLVETNLPNAKKNQDDSLAIKTTSIKCELDKIKPIYIAISSKYKRITFKDFLTIIVENGINLSDNSKIEQKED